MERAGTAGVGRTGDRLEDARQALATAAALLKRHHPAMATIHRARSGAAGPAAQRLANRLAAGGAFAGAVGGLLDAHARLAGAVRQLEPMLEQAAALPPIQRMHQLQRLPLPQLVAIGRELAAQVDRWRDDPDLAPLLHPGRAEALRAAAAARPVAPTGRLAAPTGRLAAPTARLAAPPPSPAQPGLLSRLTSAFASVPAAPAPAAAAATLPEPPPATGPVEALLEGVADARNVYAYTAARVAVVEHGITVHARPAEPPEAVCAGAAPKVLAIATALAALYRDVPAALVRSRTAADQTADCRRTLFQVDEEARRIAALPPAFAAKQAAEIRLGPLRGKVMPLTRFPATFAADPILNALFPPVA